MYKPDHVLINGKEYFVENHEPKNFFNKPIEEVAEIVFKKEDLKYKGYWWVKDAPAFVWYSPNPDRDLGHKNYVCLKIGREDKLVIMGYDEKEMKELSIKDAVVCHNCKTICWSLFRHDFHSCKCDDKEKGISVDGGSEYTRMLFGEKSSIDFVKLNFLNNMITKMKKEK